MGYTKTDIEQMRSIIRTLATAKPDSLRRKNAERRTVILNRRLTRKERKLWQAQR